MTSVNWTNITDFGDFPSWANTTTDGMFWTGILYMLWIIALLIMLPFGFEVALLSGSFLALMLGILLYYSGLVSWINMIVFIGIILFMFLYIRWSGGSKYR